jgi:hypothetical protein
VEFITALAGTAAWPLAARAQQQTTTVHDRMPVLLTEQEFEPWLTGTTGLELLKPAPDDLLQRWPVSKRVNSERRDVEVVHHDYHRAERVRRRGSSRAPDDDPTLIERISVQ